MGASCCGNIDTEVKNTLGSSFVQEFSMKMGCETFGGGLTPSRGTGGIVQHPRARKEFLLRSKKK